jgi:hypothetical protein
VIGHQPDRQYEKEKERIVDRDISHAALLFLLLSPSPFDSNLGEWRKDRHIGRIIVHR